MKRLNPLLLVLLPFAISVAGEETPQDRPKITIPIDVAGEAGAHGSQWMTEHFVRNSGTDAVYLSDTTCQFSGGSVCDIEVGPGETVKLRNRYDHDYGGSSLVYQVTDGDPDDLVFSSHLREVGLDLGPWGTELPVIRDEDYRFQTLSILNVPYREDTRISLRVYFDYSFASKPAGDTVVEVWATTVNEEVSPARMVDGALLLSSNVSDARSKDVLELHSLLAGVAVPAGVDRLRVTVKTEGWDPGMWGFASITNNATQHVTIFQSQ